MCIRDRCEHVIKIEDEYLEREGVTDEMQDRVVINLDEDDDNNDLSSAAL